MYEKKINLNGFNSHIHVVLVLIMTLKLREISLQDIVKTVWPDIHVGISAKCLLPSLWHLFVSRWLKVQREEGKRINLCPWHSFLNCTETVPRIVTFFSQEFFFFSWTINFLPETSYSVLMSFSTKKSYEWKKALFYFCWFDNIHHPGLYKSKNTFWIFGGKKFFFVWK